MRRIGTVHLIIVSLLLLLSTPASAKETWTGVQSKNFTVIGDASERDIRRLVTQLEQFRHVISLLFPKAQIETPVPTTVILFKNHDSFKPFKPRYQGKIQESVGGYFLPGGDRNYIVLTSETRGATPYEVIYHEYAHFIIRNSLPRAPLWLNEGLAEFYSTFATSDDDQKAQLGGAIPRHILALRESRLLPLSTLLAVDEKSPYYHENSKAGIFYAESWALAHYLMLGNGGKRQAQLSQFISRLNTDPSFEENFRHSFQADYKTVEDDLRSYVSKFTFPVLNVTFSRQLDYSKAMQSSPLSEAEVQYYLGDLLLRDNRPDEAEERLQKSAGLNPRFAPSQISLGILRLRQERRPEAKKFMQAAIEIDPLNYLGHYYYGYLLRQDGQYEEAVKSFQRAIQLKPDVARTFAELGYAYLSLGRDEEAIEAFKEGIRLDPKNSYFYQSRSYIYLRLARGNLAATDAITYLRRQGWRDEHSPYMVLAAHFGFRQAHRDNYASKILEDAKTMVDTSAWPHPIIEYLRHEITAEKLLGLATDNDKLTEAHAYMGLDLSLAGSNEAALTHLRWVKENGNKNFVEYPLAVAEIDRISAQSSKPDQ